jgi:hypothetical protein
MLVLPAVFKVCVAAVPLAGRSLSVLLTHVDSEQANDLNAGDTCNLR